MYGPGVMVVRTHGPVLSVTAIALTTPVDDRTSELRMLYHLRGPARSPLLSALLSPLLKLVFRKEALGEVREEVRIWDHKIHQPRPVLLPHEKGIRAIRRWYAQFYPPQTPGEAARGLPAAAYWAAGDDRSALGSAPGAGKVP
jgi:hypothetical protein